jgi:predicted alpha/beta-fold hydrolase
MQRVACLLLARDWRVVRLDLRGCGQGAAVARKTYNGGCSGDVRAAVAAIHEWDPAAPINLAGFSLGGNIVLKLAGEGFDRPVDGLEAVAAIAPPIDLEVGARLIALKRNRLYERYFVESLRGQVAWQARFFPDMPRPRFPRRLTLRLFDDLYTAPQGGFRDALDYYRSSSSSSLIGRIEIPTWILTSRDDPFIDVEPFEKLRPRANLHLEIAVRGGHLGFLGPDGAGGFRWAERRMVDWLTGRLPCHAT